MTNSVYDLIYCRIQTYLMLILNSFYILFIFVQTIVQVFRKLKTTSHWMAYQGNKPWHLMHILYIFWFPCFFIKFFNIIDWKNMVAPKKHLYTWWDNVNKCTKASLKLFSFFLKTYDVFTMVTTTKYWINSVFFIFWPKQYILCSSYDVITWKCVFTYISWPCAF